MNGYELKVPRGDDAVYTFQCLDAANNPIDITGWTLRLTVRLRDSLGDITNLITDTTENGAIIHIVVTDHVDPENGLSQFSFAQAQTKIDSKDYVFDIQAVDDQGKKSTLMIGDFVIDLDVTRA